MTLSNSREVSNSISVVIVRVLETSTFRDSSLNHNSLNLLPYMLNIEGKVIFLFKKSDYILN